MAMHWLRLIIIMATLSALAVPGHAFANETFHGRLLARGNHSYFVYSENGQEKEIEVPKKLDEFRGQLMTISGKIQDNFLVVDWALTDKNSFIRGKKGRGFMGSGTLSQWANELRFTPHLSKATLDEIEGYYLQVSFPTGIVQADGEFAVVDVIGVIANNKIHIAAGFDGLRVRQDEIEAQVGDTLVIEGKLFDNLVSDVGTHEIQVDKMHVLNKESNVAMPAYSQVELHASLGNEHVKEIVATNEESQFVGVMDSPGHVTITEVMPFFDPFTTPQPGGNGSCETNVTGGKPKPKFRVIKND